MNRQGETADPDNDDDARARLAVFTSRLFALAVLFAVVYIATGVITQRPRHIATGVALVAFLIPLAWSQRIGRAGDSRRSALVTCHALLLLATAVSALVPSTFPVNTLACVLAVAVALPHLTTRDLRIVTLSGLAAATSIVTLGLFLRDPAPLPWWARAVTLIGTTIAAVHLIFLLMVQHSERLVLSVKRANDRLAELSRLQSELVSRERLSALGEAAAVVAHEVRNPLGVILNVIEVLGRDPNRCDRERELLAIERDEALRIDRLVRDLLVLAKPLEPRSCVVDPSALAERSIATLRPRLESAQLALELEVDPELPQFCADPDYVQIALTNLIQNAIEATPKGGTVRVHVRRCADRVGFDVEDEGPGIDRETREKIFEPFFTTRTTGTGLGLAIVRSIMKQHGGKVRARDARTGGACFELLFAPAQTSPSLT
jgi:signal transduction histidine kinase